jgi:hypothetical protein
MEDDGEWECARCTLCNAGCDAACAACGAARGAASASEASDSDGGGSESDGDYDMATGMDGPDEAAHTVEVHVAKRRWEETEARRVKARDEAVARAGGAAAASFDEKKAAQAQIFTSQARTSRRRARALRRGSAPRARRALTLADARLRLRARCVATRRRAFAC